MSTPINTAQPFYLQSQVGTTVNPDFQGGTLRDNQNGVTDNDAYTVENFPTNTIDEFGDTVTFTGTFSGAGPLTFTDSVGGGNAIVTGTSVLGGAVTINTGATLQWGNGTGGAFLIGPGNALVDNGSLLMNFGGSSGVVGAVPISGIGSVTIQSGTFTELDASTYTGPTTINTGATFQLGSGGGSNNGTVAGNIVDNGLVQFNYTAGAGPIIAPNQFSGAGAVEFINGTTVITGASAVAGAVTIDVGATAQWGNGSGAFLVGGGNVVTDNGALVMNFGPSGIDGNLPVAGTGALELQSGLFVQTGAATLTGTTTIDAGGQLHLSGAGSFASTSDMTVNGIFDISGTTAGASITRLDGAGQVSLGAQTLTLTAASGTFSSVIQDAGAVAGTGGGLTIAGGTETLTSTNTYTGATTINTGATLKLGHGGTTGTVAGAIVDNGLVQFDYSGPVTAANTLSGSGSAEVVAGTVVVTGTSFLGGTVTIDHGATMQWGVGNPALLVGGGDAVVDNGALVMNFGGGVGGAVPISGTGTVTIQTGSLNNSGASTYTGVTTIDAAGFLVLSGTGSIADSSNVIDNGKFDISGTTAGASITTLNGSGAISLGAQTLTLTSASGAFSGVMADGGLFGGTGGGLTIAAGTEILTGTNTYTGATTINTGAALQLGNGGATGTVAGAIIDNGLVFFNYSGPVTAANDFGGSGSAVVAGTVVITASSILGGVVVIDNGATMQWGAGNPAFLIGGGDAVVDNGALVMNFGGGGISGPVSILGTGSVEIETGALTESGGATYTGVTTIDSAGLLTLAGTGSIADSSNVIDNGKFDISGTTAGASITTLSGSGGVSLGGHTLTLTAASGTFSGVMADGGLFGGIGGALTIAGGTETLTGTNTFTGATTIDLGATLKLHAGGGGLTVAGTVAGAGTLAFTGGTATLSAGATLSIAKVVQNGGTTNVNTSLAYAGVWSQSAGTLAVASGLTLALSGAGDSFAGTLSGAGTLAITGGTAALSAGATLSIAKVVQTGGAARFFTSLAYTGVWSQSAGTLAVAAGRTLTLSGSGSFAGTLAGAGTLSVAAGTDSFSATAQLTIAKVVQSGGATRFFTSLAYAGLWSQSAGTLGVASGKTLTFTGTGNLFSGALSGGLVAIAGGSDRLAATALSSGARLTITGSATAVTLAGTIANSGAITATTSHLVVDAAGATLTGGGTLTLTSAATNKLSGASATATLTNVDNVIQGGGSLGGGALQLINQAAGRIVGNAATTLVIDTGASTIQNAGLIAAGAGGGVEIRSAIANAGLLTTANGTLTLDAAVTGAGAAWINGGTLDAAAAFSENVVFVGTTGVLELAHAQAYAGKVSGFSHAGTTSLDLRDIGFVSASEATFSGTTAGGTLTVTDGTHIARIKLVGDYIGATFTAASDGHGGTRVVDPTTRSVQHFVAAMAATGPPAEGSIASGHWNPPTAPLLAHARS